MNILSYPLNFHDFLLLAFYLYGLRLTNYYKCRQHNKLKEILINKLGLTKSYVLIHVSKSLSILYNYFPKGIKLK